MAQNSNEIMKQVAQAAFSVFVVIAMVGVGIYGTERRKRNTYEPGETLSRAQRAMVDAMNDSTLVSRTTKYNEMRRDYQEQYERRAGDGTNGTTPIMQRRLNNQSRLAFPKYNPNWSFYKISDYYDLLRQFERDSIEARYKHLAKQLEKHK